MEYSNGTQLTHEKWEWGNAVHFIGSAGEIKVGRGSLETSPVQLKQLLQKRLLLLIICLKKQMKVT
jgi:hypothetical protein